MGKVPTFQMTFGKFPVKVANMIERDLGETETELSLFPMRKSIFLNIECNHTLLITLEYLDQLKKHNQKKQDTMNLVPKINNPCNIL